MDKKVVCFGEMLWDCFPDKEIPGGAPMNVALNLKQLGIQTQMISRIGKDDHGRRLLEFVENFGLDTTLIQTDDRETTGKVIVDNHDVENIKYNIVSPAAWDFIDFTDENKAAVSQADAFIFGSLAVRNKSSWNTLYQLLHLPVLKLFDINLRAPYFDFEQIEIILGFTDILKINEDELQIVADHFGISSKIETFCQFLTTQFPIKMICITLGSKGAMIFQHGKIATHEGHKVRVVDTVGSGDAFLSGFVKMYLEGKSAEEILNFSCALGAYVATKQGGTPVYEIQAIYDLMDQDLRK